MLNRDRAVISSILSEMGFHILAKHAKVDFSNELTKGYIAIIVRQCILHNDRVMQEKLFKFGIISRPEFYKIAARLSYTKGF